MSATPLGSLFNDVPPMLGAALVTQTLGQYLVYVGAIVLVTVMAALWMVTLRQSDGRPGEQRQRRPSRRWFGSSDDKNEAGGKRRRRRHRRRNPTLAETRGLPPVRTGMPSAATERYEP